MSVGSRSALLFVHLKDETSDNILSGFRFADMNRANRGPTRPTSRLRSLPPIQREDWSDHRSFHVDAVPAPATDEEGWTAKQALWSEARQTVTALIFHIDTTILSPQNPTYYHPIGHFPMFALQRQQLITDRIKAHGRVTVTDLARELDTSHETIRRDLAALEEAGGLKRVHGGAIDVARVGGPEPPMAARASLRADEKKRIARAALAHVPDTGTILLESASTSLFLAEMLPDGARTTIVTNGLDIAHGLAGRGFDVVMLGGRVRNRSLATLDDWVHPALESLHADVAFLGTLGFTTHAGLTAPDLPDAAIKRRCLGIAERNLLLAESAKFGVVALCRYADLSDFDLLITDTGLSEAAAEDIRSVGIDVVMA